MKALKMGMKGLIENTCCENVTFWPLTGSRWKDIRNAIKPKNQNWKIIMLKLKSLMLKTPVLKSMVLFLPILFLTTSCVQGTAIAKEGSREEKAALVADSPYKRPSDENIRSMLTRLQYDVTQKEVTEKPYANEYWNSKADGIFVDIVSGEPLFSSRDKYDSKTGWPSFSRAIDSKFIVKKTDYRLIYPRTELRSTIGDSHLGHLFPDGPAPTGQRYCINSASLKFVKKEDMVAAGYGQYANLFE